MPLKSYFFLLLHKNMIYRPMYVQYFFYENFFETNFNPLIVNRI